MNDILQLILITSIWCLGIRIVTEDGMALAHWRVWGDKQVEAGKKIYEPLFICEWCMPSIHSTIGFFIGWGLGIVHPEWRWILMYPLVVAGSSFVTGMSWLIYSYLNIRQQYYSNIEKLSHWDIKDRKARHAKSNHS